MKIQRPRPYSTTLFRSPARTWLPLPGNAKSPRGFGPSRTIIAPAFDAAEKCIGPPLTVEVQSLTPACSSFQGQSPNDRGLHRKTPLQFAGATRLGGKQKRAGYWPARTLGRTRSEGVKEVSVGCLENVAHPGWVDVTSLRRGTMRNTQKQVIFVKKFPREAHAVSCHK